MITPKEHFHGSDLEKIEAVYSIKKEDITSFSANVNPLGVSPLLRSTLASHIDAITSYPDREYTSLRKCIAAYTGTDASQVIVGNGSTELISLFIQIEHPKKAMILGPTYSEYEREISLGGGTTLYYPLREKDDFVLDVDDFTAHLNESIDLLVLCNPNNPTSSCINRTDMRRILDICKQYDIFVMVDETYVEFADNMDEITAVPLTHYYNNIIILRGTSKFFAAPGLRLGYAISGNQDLIKSINTRKTEHFQVVFIDRTALACFPYAGNYLVAIELFDVSGTLDHQQHGGFHRRETFSAFRAFAPAANGVTVLADAGIDHLRIWVLAKRAMHGLHNSLNH